ncbi:hypothetical protein ElyMa_004161700, partial [Elysia marginata]
MVPNARNHSGSLAMDKSAVIKKLNWGRLCHNTMCDPSRARFLVDECTTFARGARNDLVL